MSWGRKALNGYSCNLSCAIVFVEEFVAPEATASEFFDSLFCEVDSNSLLCSHSFRFPSIQCQKHGVVPVEIKYVKPRFTHKISQNKFCAGAPGQDVAQPDVYLLLGKTIVQRSQGTRPYIAGIVREIGCLEPILKGSTTRPDTLDL